MAIGGGQNRLSCVPASIAFSASLEIHSADSSSFGSMVMSSFSASSIRPTIREEGNGQGWQAKYSALAGSLRMPASSSSSRDAACSIVSPGSQYPARQDTNPAGHMACRPMRHLSSFTASMIATGSVRGKCSALQAGHMRFQPASEMVVPAPHFAQKPCAACHRNRLRAVDAQFASRSFMRAAAARKSTNSPMPATREASVSNSRGRSIAKMGVPRVSFPRNSRGASGETFSTSGPIQTSPPSAPANGHPSRSISTSTSSRRKAASSQSASVR